MNLKEEPIIMVNSKFNSNKYYLYRDKIIIKNNKKDKVIVLPQEENIINFYDMYYDGNILNIIVSTRNMYDYRYILDEVELKLLNRSFSK